MGDFSAVFASRLRETRKRMEKSQREFAEMVGCTAATLSSYENGAKSPSLEIVRSIAEKCNISLDWLCGLDDKASEREKSEINTYSDLFFVLLDLCKRFPRVFDAVTIEDIILGQEVDVPHMRIDDTNVLFFFRDWEKMQSLLTRNSIDDEIFDLWIEKTMKKFDTPISEKNKLVDSPF